MCFFIIYNLNLKAYTKIVKNYICIYIYNHHNMYNAFWKNSTSDILFLSYKYLYSQLYLFWWQVLKNQFTKSILRTSVISSWIIFFGNVILRWTTSLTGLNRKLIGNLYLRQPKICVQILKWNEQYPWFIIKHILNQRLYSMKAVMSYSNRVEKDNRFVF